MSPPFFVPGKWAVVGLFALILPAPVLAQTLSQPRVLRLSFVEGNVTLARPDVQRWAQAPVNTPLQQGFNLSTGTGSFAEIQFENGSTIRLGEQSMIALTELAETADGNKVDQLELRQGYATFHPISPGTQESMQVSTPQGRLSASSDAEFRVDIDQGMERVEVFTGMVDADSNLGSAALQADSVLVFQPGAPDPAQVSQGIAEDDWDLWISERDVQISSSGPSPSSYTDEPYEVPYGWDDLAQNGAWVDVDGFGYGWSPNVPVGWSPYSSGQWCWYQGVGYTWIGSESWSWLPYHYGEWEFVPGHGWVWLPDRIKTWSPARVNWYEGSGWVGWRPKGRDRTGREDCGTTCGGGSLTTRVFNEGGSLSPNNMLGVNFASGSKVATPNVVPSTTVKLAGQPQTFSAAEQGHGTWSVSRSQIGPWAPGPSTRRQGSTSLPNVEMANPGIVFDSNAGGYVNRQPPARPPIDPSGSLRPSALSPLAPNPSANPGATATSPWQSPSQVQPGIAAPTGGQAPLQPVQGVFASPTSPRPDAPNSATHPAAGAAQAGTAQPGTGSSRSGGWTPAGGQSSVGHGSVWAPASGSSSSSAASAPSGHH